MDDPKRSPTSCGGGGGVVRVHTVMRSYLKKRNHGAGLPLEISASELLGRHTVDGEVARPNSILYGFTTTDPTVIDHNFSKLVLWLKESAARHKHNQDLEYMVAPLFCHLYLDILHGGNAERAAAFYKCHMPSVDRVKCDDRVLEVMSCLGKEAEVQAATAVHNFRATKYVLELRKESFVALKKFVLDFCHVVFLNVLQTYFDVQVPEVAAANDVLSGHNDCKPADWAADEEPPHPKPHNDVHRNAATGITNCVDEEAAPPPTSALHGCTAAGAIEHNFADLVRWLQHEGRPDLEAAVAPLFCHLYLDLLHGGHADLAAGFHRRQRPAAERAKCEGGRAVQEVMCRLGRDGGEYATAQVHKFRAAKCVLRVRRESRGALRKFVRESCQPAFGRLLDAHLDVRVAGEAADGAAAADRLGRLSAELHHLPKSIFNVNVGNNRREVSSGLLRRRSGLLVYADRERLHVRPLDSRHAGDTALAGHTGRVYTMDMSAGGDVLCTGSSDNSVCLYGLGEEAAAAAMRRCDGHLGAVYCARTSPKGEYAVSGSQDTTARLWSTATGQTVRTMVGHAQAVTAVDFHPNCLYVATGSADSTVRMWSIGNAEPVRLLHGAKGTVHALGFNPNGHCLATAGGDNVVRIWDLVQSKVMAELQCYGGGPVAKLAWSDDGKWLCGGTCDGLVAVWNFGRMEEASGEQQCREPALTKYVSNRLLGVDYAYGGFGTLTAAGP